MTDQDQNLDSDPLETLLNTHLKSAKGLLESFNIKDNTKEENGPLTLIFGFSAAATEEQKQEIVQEITSALDFVYWQMTDGKDTLNITEMNNE